MTATEAYIQALQKEYAKGDATEHTYRPALKALLESFAPQVQATNEPKAFERENKPDYIVRRAAAIAGFVEAKDINVDLNATLKTAQLKRYLEALPNLILTNYLDFIWFVRGQQQMRITLGTVKGKHIARSADSSKCWHDFLQSFFNEVTSTVNSPLQLAKGLAGQTRLLRDLVAELIAAKDPDLLSQESAFKTLLVPDLTAEQFADMYAQTAAYGLFTARVFEHTKLLGGAVELVPASMKHNPFNLEKAAYLIPKANPFLRQFFQHVASPDLNFQLRWLIEQIADGLRYTELDKVLHRQGRRHGFEDPIFHFYETFLAEYDNTIREQRGVYYTPEPVVDFIVRSVDVLLKERFHCPDGLADKKTLILDPATGTATFLRRVIDVIHKRIMASGNAGIWTQYVHERLLPRVFGFEWMMAPYTVAHLKLELQLQELGFGFNQGERLNVFLTNTLDQLHSKTTALLGDWIARENEGAEKVKLTEPVEVVLGNPPYFGESRNKSAWIMALLRSYKTEPEGGPLKERNSKWLNNDYVKFIRFAHDRIARTGHGIVAFITSNSWLDSPTFRGMRSQLMQEFNEIYVLDLHGNANKGERTPEHLLAQGDDKNVFDIVEGVGITFLVKLPQTQPAETFELTAPDTSIVTDKKGKKLEGQKLAGGKITHHAQIRHLDLWGSREYKYDWLEKQSLGDVAWQVLKPRLPLLLLVPRDESDIDEYEKGWKVTDVFPFYGTGVITKCDQLNIHFSPQECLALVTWFVNSTESAARARLRLPKAAVRDWSYQKAIEDVTSSGLDPANIRPILYRPFDTRYTYYTGRPKGIMGWPVERLMNQFTAGPNVALITSRMTKGERFAHAQVTDKISEVICMSSKTSNNGFIFPLWHAPKAPLAGIPLTDQRYPNLSPGFLATLAQSLGKSTIQPHHLPDAVSPEDVLTYVYAVLHAPSYRQRYSQYLKSDFPRIPIAVIAPTDKAHSAKPFAAVWKALIPLGHELMELHLLRKVPAEPRARFPHEGSRQVEKVRYEAPKDKSPGRVWINTTQCFEGVEPGTWAFMVGGYQVCEKWLKIRKGRTLTLQDIEHYQNIVAALTRTRAVMTAIDDVVNGTLWPLSTPSQVDP